MTVLIPMTVRPTLPQGLAREVSRRVESLASEIGDARVVYDYSEWPKREGENFYARLARGRQAMIDRHLTPDVTDVMWVDADVAYRPTVYRRLRRASSGVAAPLVLIEGTNANYDTAGFRETFEERSGTHPPYFHGKGPVVQLEAVGACVVFPADVHRNFRFQAMPDSDKTWNTEFWLICQHAKKMGYEVVCDTRIKTYHANLPLHGEGWH